MNNGRPLKILRVHGARRIREKFIFQKQILHKHRCEGTFFFSLYVHRFFCVMSTTPIL